MLFLLDRMVFFIFAVLPIFAIVYWGVKRAARSLDRLDNKDVPTVSERFRKARLMAIIYGIVASIADLALYQVFNGYAAARRQIAMNPYIDHLAWQSSVDTPGQKQAQFITFLILVAAVVFSWLTLERVVLASLFYMRDRKQVLHIVDIVDSGSLDNVQLAGQESGVAEPVNGGGRKLRPLIVTLTATTAFAAVLFGMYVFHARANRAPMASPSAVTVLSPPASVASPLVNIVAEAGFWAAKIGESAENNREFVVAIDDKDALYFVPVNKQGVESFTPEMWNTQEPGRFLVIEKISIEQWQQGVKNFPGQRMVRVVKALCKQGISVKAFTVSGLVDADNVLYSDACPAVADLTETPQTFVDKVASAPQSRSPTQAPPTDDPAVKNSGPDDKPVSDNQDFARTDASQQDAPNNVDARKLNAQALQMMSENPRDLMGARRALETAARLAPLDMEIQNNLGDVYNRTGAYGDAESVLLRVVSMAPTRRVAYGNLGYAEAKLGNATAASTRFCQYIRLFKSPEQGKSTLAHVINDPDVIVQSAVQLAISNCTQ